MEFAVIAAGNAGGSVLTSGTRDVELQRGTQMLLLSEASGSAQGAVQSTTRGAGAAGTASGAATTGVSTTRR